MCVARKGEAPGSCDAPPREGDARAIERAERGDDEDEEGAVGCVGLPRQQQQQKQKQQAGGAPQPLRGAAALAAAATASARRLRRAAAPEPAELARRRAIFEAMTEAQRNRYEAFRRSLNKGKMRKLAAAMAPAGAPPPLVDEKVALAVCSAVEGFAGEVVERRGSMPFGARQ